MGGRLTLLGTPIGNLSDLSPRALETLKACDVIAAEDTRVTLRLLNAFGIKKTLVSYHEHNKGESGHRLCARMQNGEHVVLVTDAGMPAISDPGELLVAQCHALGIAVEAVPGPTAVATAVALSGLPSGRFAFEGFLSVQKAGRREHLNALLHEQRTMVFYEAPHKLVATLKDLAAAFGGERRIALVRELTKLHEETVLTTLAGAVERYEAAPPRGEFVLVIEGAAPPEDTAECPREEAVERANRYRAQGLRASEAAKRASAETGYSKNELYRELMKGESE